MAKLFGCQINDEDGGGSSTPVEVSLSGNQTDGEATSFSAGLPPTIPYFRFLESNSDSMESESDLHHCFIDFFDRESYVSSNQRLSTSYDDSNVLGIQDMEIELGLRIGSRSGSDHSVGLGLQVTEIDSSRVEVDSGRVEVDSGRVEVVSDLTLVEVEAQDPITWVSEPLEANLLSEEEDGISLPMDYTYNNNQEDQEWLSVVFDGFFEDAFDIFDPYLLTSIDEYGENHEAVLARTFDDDESGIMGSPPASKRVVEELPDVEINNTSEKLSIGCAICKDEIVVEVEKVKRLPCKHYYHGDCIVTWLGIRNTCPVCRYELPTDDLEYERNRRAQRAR